MRKLISWHIFLLVLFCLPSCKDNGTPGEETPVIIQTPVTVTRVGQDTLAEFIELNASSTFLLKNFVKANANGYLQSAHLEPGQYVKPGQTLFTIKTKEAESIGNAVNKLDTSFKFTGTNVIRAGSGGFISQLNHQSGDYVQDGDPLAVISDQNSFVFLMELPYELKPLVNIGNRLEVLLPDGEKLPGRVTALMPLVDAVSQTQNVVITVTTTHTIPENLIGKVKIPKAIRDHALSLPRASVLSNETQSEFWVMKMTDSTTAIKVPVKKGIETKDRIEILSPVFSPGDKILLSGNYGLGDTARVKIVQP
jgi:multidrug efflux pump subunit AcrA (membrane-fusion protein)